MPKGPNTPSTHTKIRDIMQEEGEVTTRQVQEKLKEWCEENGWNAPTTKSISDLLITYRNRNLIKKVGEKEIETNLPTKANVYKLAKPNSKLWEQPKELA